MGDSADHCSADTHEERGGEAERVETAGTEEDGVGPEPVCFLPSFDCVRHFEPEKLLSFTSSKQAQGIQPGDPEYESDLFPLLPP